MSSVLDFGAKYWPKLKPYLRLYSYTFALNMYNQITLVVTFSAKEQNLREVVLF